MCVLLKPSWLLKMYACLVERGDIGMELLVRFHARKASSWTLTLKFVNALHLWTGMERNVSHVPLGRSLILNQKAANASTLSSGMGSPVPDCQTAIMGKSGMCILIVASAPIICIGQKVSASKSLSVRAEECWMLHINVSAQRGNFGMGKDAPTQLALEAKFGMALNASVLLGRISMEQSVCSASMANSGMKMKRHASALQAMNGRGWLAIKLISVLGIGYGTQFSNTVFAQRDSFGMEGNAWFNQHVLEAECGMFIRWNAFVLVNLSGIRKNVSNAWMDNYGTNLQGHACAREGQSGRTTCVGSYRNVMEAWYGIRTYGPASALLELSGMAIFVSPIPAQMGGCGMNNINHASVRMAKSGQQAHVSLQELTATMDKYGIQPFMPAHVPLEHSPTSTNVIRSHSVGTARNITPWTINANAPMDFSTKNKDASSQTVQTISTGTDINASR